MGGSVDVESVLRKHMNYSAGCYWEHWTIIHEDFKKMVKELEELYGRDSVSVSDNVENVCSSHGCDIL